MRLYIQKKATSATYDYANYDLTSATVTATVGSPTATSIVAVGNGWHRISISSNVGTGGTATPTVNIQHLGSAGNGSNGILLWGAQLEDSGTLGPYLRTGASATASTLRIGSDSSVSTGGYNSWFANNFSVTPGVGNDSLTDSPSNYGAISTTLVNDTYQISKSLRFNSADTANLTRTLTTSGNLTTWTWSGWVKRTKPGSGEYLFHSGDGSAIGATIAFTSSDQLEILYYSSGYIWRFITTQAFRDPTSWYNIVVAYDSGNATQADRVRLHVNGVRITSFGTSIPVSTINQVTSVNNSTYPHSLGGYSSAFFNGYLAEVNFIDGQALTPTSFGTRDINTYLWKPKAYTGTYGTNGFYLNFSDSSNTTAATLGKDQAGSNNWTPSGTPGFSVSAGPGNDSLVDSPTYYGTDTGVGGEARGNYCTLNPNSTTAGTFSNGNLRFVGPSNPWARANGTINVSSGKWYYEVTLANAPFSPRSASTGWNVFGFGPSSVFNSSAGANSATDALVLVDSGYLNNFAGSSVDVGALASGDVLSVAVDLDANTYTFRRNNTQIATGTIGGTAGRLLTPCIISYDGQYGVMDVNLGQRPFIHAAPSGFRALLDYNKLPTPTGG